MQRHCRHIWKRRWRGSIRSASPSLLAPFDYTALIWAVVIGYVLFGNLPNGSTVAGMALIAGAGMFIAYRESRAAKAGCYFCAATMMYWNTIFSSVARGFKLGAVCSTITLDGLKPACAQIALKSSSCTVPR